MALGAARGRAVDREGRVASVCRHEGETMSVEAAMRGGSRGEQGLVVWRDGGFPLVCRRALRVGEALVDDPHEFEEPRKHEQLTAKQHPGTPP